MFTGVVWLVVVVGCLVVAVLWRGLERRFGRCALIPIVLNVGALAAGFGRLLESKLGAKLTGGGVSVVFMKRLEEGKGYYVVWVEAEGVSAVIVVVDCRKVPRGDLASTLAAVMSAMVEVPRTREQGKWAGDVLITLYGMDGNLGVECVRYIEERGWPVLPYEFYLESCMRDPSMIRLAIETLVEQGKRKGEAVKLAMEMVENLPLHVLANEIVNILLRCLRRIGWSSH